MRLIAISAAALLAGAAVAPTAQAQSANPPIGEVSVAIGPKLQAKADKEHYGQDELDRLTQDLRRTVERRLDKTGQRAAGGARLELVLVDVTPNRPTFEQMGAKPGLSMESFGLGGAEISGRIVGRGGDIPLNYRWYETDLRNSASTWTWSDADTAFDGFARRLASGDARADARGG